MPPAACTSQARDLRPKRAAEGDECSGSNSECENNSCHRIDRDGNNYKCCSDNYWCWPTTPGSCKAGFFYCNGYP